MSKFVLTRRKNMFLFRLWTHVIPGDYLHVCTLRRDVFLVVEFFVLKWSVRPRARAV